MQTAKLQRELSKRRLGTRVMLLGKLQRNKDGEAIEYFVWIFGGLDRDTVVNRRGVRTPIGVISV